MKDCPFEAWQLIQAREILKWVRDNSQFGINSINLIEIIEDLLFNIAHGKLGLKPISKCTIQELQEEFQRRLEHKTVTLSEINVEHKYVDLGLPSGLKWATCNVGASSPEGYGNYYAWGETTTKTNYTESSYVNIGNNISGTQYDVARTQWGGSWRMPTLDEIKELREKCTWQWTTYNGVTGYRVTGSNGNSIFLPAAGYRYGSEVYHRGTDGLYWSSSLYSYYSSYAYDLYFDSGRYDWNYGSRFDGHTVRPVSE